MSRVFSSAAARIRGGGLAPADLVWIGLSMLLAHALSPVFLGDVLGRGPILASALDAACFVLIGLAIGLYDLDVVTRREEVLRRAALASVLAPLATLGLFYAVFYAPIGRRVVAQAMLLGFCGVVLIRATLWAILGRRRRRVLFLGHGPLAEATVHALDHAESHPYEIVRHDLSTDATAQAERVQDLVRTREIDEIVVPLDRRDQADLLPAIVRALPPGCRVTTEPDFHEDVFRRVPVLHVPPAWMLAGGVGNPRPAADFAKRAGDIALALVLLVVSLPVAAFAALLVALGGDGPVFFSQERVGRSGRLFRILKFRTMRTDAESTAAQWARDEDPRCTPAGRVLRRTRIDELPQLINILRGEMSFVGPRPERPEFTPQLEAAIPYYGFRHLVRPGLSGWAQIHYPYGSSVEDARHKLELDLYYLRHRSLLLDVVILLRTATRLTWGGR
jgi:exopolysaccharide biosynthesis polyprenyl glycosylphosphotransferase